MRIIGKLNWFRNIVCQPETNAIILTIKKRMARRKMRRKRSRSYCGVEIVIKLFMVCVTHFLFGFMSKA